jgi:predicted nucleotidyltransferase
MDKESVIATLRAHEAELRAEGISHVYLFGSVARGEPTRNQTWTFSTITIRSASDFCSS